MARPARSPAERRVCQRSRLLLLLWVGLDAAGCGRGAPPAVETWTERWTERSTEHSIEQSDPGLRDRNGVLELDGAPLSGYVVEHAGAALIAKTRYLRGRRHGLSYGYHPDGTLRYERLYRDGEREGIHRGYWPTGTPQFVYRYEHDLFEGEQLAFYKNGVRAELRHFHRGQEEGRQTTWDGTGRVTANYTFKEGRRYGIVGSFDCVTVHAP